MAFSDSDDDRTLREALSGGGILELKMEGDPNSDSDAGSAEGKGGRLKLKLSAAEVAVLCWERGLLRRHHCSDGTRRWGAIECKGPVAEGKAMLNRREKHPDSTLPVLFLVCISPLLLR